jgi:Family of unknown function (DUF6636)
MQRRAVLLVLCGVALASTGTAAAAKTQLPGIRSPSGNISCLFVPGGGSNLLCAIGHSSYGGALQNRCMQPDGSGVDWHGFELRATKAGQVLCTGGILYSPDTQKPHYVTLPYGKSWHHASFTCESRRTGVTCKNRAGHGLFVSRESYRIW